MEAEVNIERQKAFYAHYFGQNVAVVSKGNYLHKLGEITDVDAFVLSTIGSVNKLRFSLRLKPLSSITEEDTEAVCKIISEVSGVNFTSKEVAVGISTYGYASCWTVDYLRSKRYALDWMGLTVEEMVSAGWIKLIS